MRVATQSAADSTGTARFTILVRGARIGSETVTVSKRGANWQISAVGRLLPPADMITTKFELSYAGDWQPQNLSIEGQLRGQLITLDTSFGLTTATSDMLQAGKRGSVTHSVTPRALVLPNNFFAAYEALALRLGSAEVGTRVPVYVAPDGEISVTVDRVTPRRIALAASTVEIREINLTFLNPAGPFPVDIWVDSRNRLARVAVPATSMIAIREDLATVMAREERVSRPNDEVMFVPGNGFNMGATISKPATSAPGKLPAVILVAGAGPQDRDLTSFGIPVFGQLAGALADAGYLVVRYDRRGSGQSGGRTENATLTDYTDDVIEIVRWLGKRKDVDPNRIALVSHAEGGAVAMLAASREKRIRTIALLEAAGRTGRDVTIEQQERLLARMNLPEAERAEKIAMQQRVVDATIRGTGWEGVPNDVRQQADTPLFKSYLLFDPAVAIMKVEQPVLILQGALDTQFPPAYADRLDELARSRKGAPPTYTRKVIVPGVNHLLVPATTGDVDEYATLTTRAISAEVSAAITSWLKDAFSLKK